MNVQEELKQVQAQPWIVGGEFSHDAWMDYHQGLTVRLQLGENVLVPVRTDDRKGGYTAKCLFSGNQRAMEVSIFSKSRYGAKDAPDQFEVNWSAMGSQSPEVAVEYADLLRFAAETAGWLNVQAELGLGPWKEV